MASNEPMADLIAKASFHFFNTRPFLPMYMHLILSALFPIYTGAHASLSRPSSADRATKQDKQLDSDDGDDDDDDDDEEGMQKMEGLSNKDAIILPVTAGLVLSGLYFLIMRYGAELVNLILGWYFSVLGVYSVAKLANDGLYVLVSFVFPTYYASGGALWKVTNGQAAAVRQDDTARTHSNPLPPFLNALPLPKPFKSALWSMRRGLKQKFTVRAFAHTIIDVKAKTTLVNVFSALVGLGTIIYVNTVSKPWFLTNLQGFAVSYSALQLISPTTFPTGNLILGALFCYDIWAVFFTPFMVGVAKNLDQPIKLVFPRPAEPSPTPGEPPIRSYSMLGLGDIVLPGIMIGLALRFDLYLFYMKKQKRTSRVVTDVSGNESTEETIEKSPYLPVIGHWGDRFWTYRLQKSTLPVQLRTTFPKPYFKASMIGYVVGMLATLGVMGVFKHAQPALLYLVPGVLISLWTTALVKGEVKQMWDFSEALTGEQLVDSEGKKADEKEGEDGDAEKPAKGMFEWLWAEIWPSTSAKEQSSSTKKEEETTTTSGSNDNGNEDASGTDTKSGDLLFSFSVSRCSSKTLSGRRASPASGNSTAKQTESPARSENSDDTVVVSPDDLDDTKEADEGARRRRTRSSRTHAG